MASQKQIIFLLFISILFPAVYGAAKNKKSIDFYQIKVYHCKSNEQISLTEQFLKEDYLPALHQLKYNKIGVFKPIDNDTSADKRIIIFIPSSSLDAIMALDDKIADKMHLSDYVNATFNNPPYQRIETIILKAFKNSPHFSLPNITGSENERVYELRSYEGATEKLERKKVFMFNEGNEIGIFSTLKFNPVFYAQVIAGSHMPNLMYMTSFISLKERDEHWKTFSSFPEWKRLSSLPEYQNTVSKHDIILLHATEYSDL